MLAIERDRQIHRAFLIINAQRVNPATGRKINDATKKKLFLFFYYLTEIQSRDSYEYEAPAYNKTIHVRQGDIRKSWQMIADTITKKSEQSICAKTAMRLARILKELDLLTIEHEQFGAGTRHYVRPGVHYLKVIRLKTWSEFEEFEAEMAVEDLLVKVNNIIRAATGEEELVNYEVEEEVYGKADGGSESFCPPLDSSNIYNTNTSVLDGQKLISPAESDNWRVQVAIDSVKAERRLIPRDEIPEEYDGEYHATWIGEKAGQFYTPWILWDVDGESHEMEITVGRVRLFVKSLLQYVPESAIRVVFSTRKGFHVYLDSRTVGLKPSDSLHEQIKRFALKLLSDTDHQIYDRSHPIAIPNSIHRVTKLYYVPLTIEELFECSIQQMRLAARHPQEFDGREDTMAESPHLSQMFNESVDRPRTRTGFPGLETIKQSLLEGHPARHGVKRGSRDRAMYDLSMYYRRLGLPIDDTYFLVLRANDRNQPPMPREDIKKKVNSAYAKDGVTIA